MDADLPLENEDLLQNVLTKLPAKDYDYPSAACVSKSWNKVCNRILSQPKLATAVSLNSHLDDAVQEVLDKINRKLASQIPIITNAADGMIGMDACTSLIREAKCGLLEEDHDPDNFGGLCNLISQINYCGIVLVVGRLPRLKIETIPVLELKKDGRFLQNPKAEMIDKFLTDIKEYTATVSECTFPVPEWTSGLLMLMVLGSNLVIPSCSTMQIVRCHFLQ